MRTSAAGNEVARRARGFTLIELLVVVAIIAIATAGVSFALRDSQSTQLEREGQRLAALLESARAQSRATGVPVRWRAAEGGFRFEGLQAGALPEQWLSPSTQVMGNTALVLGPDPIIGRQEVVIAQAGVPGRQLRIATDGLRPFRITAADAGS
ncbi:MAG TPA: prepilin-type N-terminal cleavage/methylation domain-containing protein [Ramlibacter sp.]|nr:prepilin-type N-terminal cleavage/methylation domain-containing protein [Ramlibacter sp.]